MQVTLSAGLSVVATLVSLGVAAFAWRRRRRTPGAKPVVAFSLGTAVWTVGNALQSASTSLSAKLFWADVQYLGLAVIPLGWFAFACEYTRNDEWLDRRTLAALGTPLLVTVLLAWTNQFHHLVRTSSEVVARNGTVALHRTFGPAFWGAWVFSNLVTGVGTLLLLRGVLQSRRIFRRQTFAVLTGVTVPWAAAVLFHNGAIAVEPEAFFSVTGVAFAYAITEHDLLDLVPVGRNTVVEEMDDPVLVLVLDDENRIVDANPAACGVFGWSDVDAELGRPIAEVDLPQSELLGTSTAGETPDVVTVADDEGERRYFDVQRSSLSDSRGSTSGTALILRDVTSLKRQEARLERKNERLERVGETIAHDLRNPLNVAQGRLELAMELDAADEHLAEVAAAHERMDAIIDEVLTMAREEEVDDAEWVGFRDVATDAWSHVDTDGAALDLDCDGVVMLASRSELTSVFENLFRNSVEHGSSSAPSSTGDGADLTVRVGTLDEGSGFYVEDDGSGIPADERDRVFETGYTTSDGGTGVGLSVVADVVERHGWSVEATDGDDGGARFEFRGVDVATAQGQ